MEPIDFEELLAQARHTGAIIRTVYRDITGEDLDLESAVRHYPLIALSLAAGAGATGGWWFARKRQAQLPAPETPTRAPLPPAQPSRSREYLEEMLPGAVERMRDALPEIYVSEELKARARGWLGNIVEEQLRQNVDTVVENVDTRLATFFRRTMQRFEPNEDIRLDDPENSEKGS